MIVYFVFRESAVLTGFFGGMVLTLIDGAGGTSPIL